MRDYVVHEVQAGETYISIAKKVYAIGSPTKWRVIYNANQIPVTELKAGLLIFIPIGVRYELHSEYRPRKKRGICEIPKAREQMGISERWAA